MHHKIMSAMTAREAKHQLSGAVQVDDAYLGGERTVPRDLPQFKWVNTVLGNIKTMLSGAYKAFEYAKYADHYLGAFAYRFNRRFDLTDLVVLMTR
jgi:hypothetical protein